MTRNITTKSPGRFAAWVAVLAMVEGCAEAPRLADDPGRDEVVGETKDAHRDDASSRAAVGVEEREVGPGDEDPIEDEPASQPRSSGEDDEESERFTDSGRSAARDASDEPTAVTTPEALDAGTDAASGDTSPEHDPCDSSLCYDGGACSDDVGQGDCVCPDGYTGQHCELKVCGSISIRSRADVEEHGDCAKVQGDLTISSVSLAAINADDFPFLTEITGDLMLIGAQTPEPPHLESVTLANLRAVDGAVVVLGAPTIDLGASGPLSELHLPALERIGARGPVGLVAHQSNLRVLDLPALETIEGSVALNALVDLCTAELDSVEHIGGDLVIRDVPRLSARHLESLRTAVAGATSESMLGCCAPSSADRVSCESFTESARALSCTGWGTGC
jgi:hypothetical protein